MAVRHPCYRHARTPWIAGCPDCTAWHRATLAERGVAAEERRAEDRSTAESAGTTAAA